MKAYEVRRRITHGLQKDFKDYQVQSNKRAMMVLLLMATVFEVLHLYLSNYLAAGIQTTMAPPSLLQVESTVLVLAVIIFFFLMIHFKYEAYSTWIDFVVLGFIMVWQLNRFITMPEIWLSLVFWVVLALMMAWVFIGPKTIGTVLSISYIWFVRGSFMGEEGSVIYVPFIWLLFLVFLLALILSFVRNRRALNEFEFNANLQEDYLDIDKKLNYDDLTGLSTSYALDTYVKNFELDPDDQKVHVILMDVDQMKACNSFYGREVGDLYLQTFSKIMRFLVRGEKDIIARLSGDVFVAITTSYESTVELEKRLGRYNHLLRDEFNEGDERMKFIPWFSYGIAESDNLYDYAGMLNEAEQKMYQMKIENKHLMNIRTYGLAQVNYLSLFSESNITVIVWVPSEGWPIAFATNNMEELLGYSLDGLIDADLHYMDLVYSKDKDRVSEEVTKFLDERQEHFEQVYRLLKADGSYVWIRDYSVPVWREGELVQINGYIYDITAEMEVEHRLEEQEHMFSEIIEATNVGTWEWQILEGKVKTNERLMTMLGYDPSTEHVRNINKLKGLFHPDDLEQFEAEVKKHFNGAIDFYQMEIRMRHKDGRWVWVLDRGKVTKWTKDHQPLAMVAAQTDISYFKKTESQLRQSEKLNAVGRMAGGIAHDMNNLFMMMSGYVDLAREVDHIDRYRESVDAIETLLGRASDTVKQIMTFTRHRVYEPSRLSLNEVVRELSMMVDRTFEKTITMDLVLPDEEVIIVGDQSLIDNALLNLCINARDAMGRAGDLTISLTVVKVEDTFQVFTGTLYSGDYACVSVMDQGVGIDEKDFERIFEPFYTTKEHGGGMGLAMVVSVIKEHNGDLNIESSKGIGTTVSLYFPLVEVMQVSAEEAYDKGLDMPADHNKALKVMVVDDEPILNEVLVTFLEEKGCDVVSFTDPIHAISHFEQSYTDVDVVLMDMLMPGMSGDEAFEKLVEIDPAVRVMFLSGYSEGIEIDEKYRTNVVGFLKKPVKLNEVYDKLVLTKS